ncbi:SAF domain-containing protein [Terracoccus luteus]|uniref:Flp pilus assembly protein CpaB n=1 Tax=Terracoccus luteus TaxID=53356 RepID=A0A839PRA0_9MICO|nr:SAF domain-containing protein [Terracoccus luteus]MBB2986027.1 Flp pilus assembly protein CpaB [Terracoccus luteus]MCP2171679.1 Flp pilus assembly protein CpaB [Terracoccus luteus]
MSLPWPPRRRAAPSSRRRRARRARVRRVVAALLAGSAVLVTLSALARDRAPVVGAPTVVAVRAMAAGTVVGADDVEVVSLPVALRPESAMTASSSVVGRTTAAALEAREVLTPPRLVGADLLAGQPAGHVAMTLPVQGASTLGATAGSHVDLWATGTGERAVDDAVVLAVAGGGASAPTFGEQAPATVTLALSSDAAARVATHLSALGAGDRFVVALRRLPASSQ